MGKALRRNDKDTGDDHSPKVTRSVSGTHGQPVPRKRNGARQTVKEWRVVDDWPEGALFEEASLRVFEAHFSDLLDLICDGG